MSERDTAEIDTIARIVRILYWPTAFLSDQLRRIPAMRRFDAWANDLERRWHRSRNVSLVAALHDAGLPDLAEKLEAATRVIPPEG